MAGIADVLPAKSARVPSPIGVECVPLEADRRASAARIKERLMGGELIETIPPASECFLNFHSRLLKLSFHR
jgi:hypothetical protein